MIGLMVLLILIGVGLYFVNTYVPMAAPIKTILNVVVVVCVCFYILQIFGYLDIPLPRRIGR